MENGRISMRVLKSRFFRRRRMFFLSFAVKRQEKPSLLACYCRILALFYQVRFSKKTLRKALISI